MREILFRGKRRIDGEWIAGSLCTTIPSDDEYYTISYFDEDIYYTEEDVIPETVGQFTGLTDKNGKKIFEGDIVKITDTIVDFETIAYIEFGNPNGLYNWGWQLVPLQKKPFAVEILHWVEMEETGAFIEVIGNLHDNPELLKGGVSE